MFHISFTYAEHMQNAMDSKVGFATKFIGMRKKATEKRAGIPNPTKAGRCWLTSIIGFVACLFEDALGQIAGIPVSKK